MKVHVFGEVLSAKNFDYDDLHVYYQLELPRSEFLNDHYNFCWFIEDLKLFKT